MKQFIVLVGVLVLLTPAVGCHQRTMGTKVDADSLAKIKKGESTKEQVLALLGPPDQALNQDGIETYAYMYTSAQTSGKSFIPFAGPFVGGSSSEHESVMITFDEKSIVKSITTTQSRYDHRRGW